MNNWSILILAFLLVNLAYAEDRDYVDPIFLVKLESMKSYENPPEALLLTYFEKNQLKSILNHQWVLSRYSDGQREYAVVGGYEPVYDQNNRATGEIQLGFQGRIIKIENGVAELAGTTDDLISAKKLLSLGIQKQAAHGLMLDYLKRLILAGGVESFQSQVCMNINSGMDDVLKLDIVVETLQELKLKGCN